MKYYYYISQKGNFGDDLNPWLWSQLFGDSNDDDSKILLGIGTILFNEFHLIKTLRSDQKKIVFGSGIRPNYKRLRLDDTWDIRFLRGPLSSASLNNSYKYIADAAYAMRLLNGFDNKYINVPKQYEVGLMPYFKSVDYFDWKKICDELGFKFISPYSEQGVEQTLFEIASCKTIITEAMHGAIVADILRVPWHRYILSTPHTEGPMVSEFKWMDWLHSIDLGGIDTTLIRFYKATRINDYIQKFSGKIVNAEFLFKSKVAGDILKTLSSIENFYLSKDTVISAIDEKLQNEITLLKSDLEIKV